MDIILKKAKQFTDRYFLGGVSHYQDIIDAAKNDVYDIDNPADKIKYLNFILDRNNKDYAEHKPVCQNPENCSYNYTYETIAYYLTQELNRLGVHFNDDTFTEEEKEQAESKLDKILKDLNELKLGQQVIYEDLSKEINELRDLYFLGKKKWYQLFIGKSVDMVASGVVSESISKQIIEEVKKSLPALIGL
ncbi:hypothetical protein SAMN05444008_114134 [Cnuella takakiae]|uniref:Uncharacterized protein n=1 Tax=Cnuella takakiae TaxID=1302690 RepID=A0A1M5FSZ0_9BACT|nr:hypothetical protein [Cnuella takakiae]OLY93655.1 hypothetical protein BUE76_18550 [Cnuella takakiae]SHF94311.1 hypothetical protein SAMN05444008_114134 [Cnuella takakiae]